MVVIDGTEVVKANAFSCLRRRKFALSGLQIQHVIQVWTKIFKNILRNLVLKFFLTSFVESRGVISQSPIQNLLDC